MVPPGANIKTKIKHKRFIWEMKESASGRVGKREKKSQPIKVM